MRTGSIGANDEETDAVGSGTRDLSLPLSFEGKVLDEAVYGERSGIEKF